MIYWFLYIFVYFSLILPYYAVKKVYAVWFFFCNFYGAQNEAYKMMEGRKVGKVVSLQRVMRGLMVEAPQNETFTLV